MKRLVFTVTNDLTYDQRMIRICTSLAANGYHVTLVGRELKHSVPIEKKAFQQVRLRCIFNRGVLFYAEFNFRLFLTLLFRKADLLCAIDLDTIVPVLFVSKIRNIKRVYDAHELFCEMKEIFSRPQIYKIWKQIERFAVPQFRFGYTVNDPIAKEFNNMYGVSYSVIRNIPIHRNLSEQSPTGRYVLYQGAVNEGRAFESLIPAFRYIDCKLVICGDGNFMQKAKELVANNRLESKIVFTGKVIPAELKEITNKATIGVTLFDDVGMSNYFSLANRFFDYMHAGIPQVCVDYPVYRSIVDQFPFALLIREISSENIASNINRLLNDVVFYKHLQDECLRARAILNWQNEEKGLIEFYQNIFARS